MPLPHYTNKQAAMQGSVYLNLYELKLDFIDNYYNLSKMSSDELTIPLNDFGNFTKDILDFKNKKNFRAIVTVYDRTGDVSCKRFLKNCNFSSDIQTHENGRQYLKMSYDGYVEVTKNLIKNYERKLKLERIINEN